MSGSHVEFPASPKPFGLQDLEECVGVLRKFSVVDGCLVVQLGLRKLSVYAPPQQIRHLQRRLRRLKGQRVALLCVVDETCGFAAWKVRRV